MFSVTFCKFAVEISDAETKLIKQIFEPVKVVLQTDIFTVIRSFLGVGKTG